MNWSPYAAFSVYIYIYIYIYILATKQIIFVGVHKLTVIKITPFVDWSCVKT